MTLSLVAGAVVAGAAAVMVRRFYPDRIVMHDAGHVHRTEPAPVEAPAAVTAAGSQGPGTNGDGYRPAGELDELAALEGSVPER
jgi:hypothetical protein